MPDAAVVPIREEEPEQTSFDGFPLVGKRFSLIQAKGLPANRDLHQEQVVTGTFTGIVKGCSHRRDGKAFGADATYILTWEIEVIEAELS